MLLYNDITILIIQYCMKKCFGLIGVLNVYLMYVYFYLLKVKGFIAITLSVDLSVQMCSVHFFYYVENQKFLHHKNIAVDPRVFQDFDPRSFRQFPGLREEKCKIRFRSVSFLSRKIVFFSSHPDCYDLNVCHYYDHGHMDQFNVTGRKIVYPCLVPIFLWKIMRISYFTKHF